MFKQEGEHRDGCWGHEAGGFCAAKGTLCRDKAGRKNNSGHSEWFVFSCNDPDCEAKALVRWDALTDFVNAGIAALSPFPPTPEQEGESERRI